MPEISFDGLEGLMLSMKEISVIPDEVKDAMLEAQADFLADEIRKRGEGYGVQDSGDMLASIKKGKPKKGKNGGRQIAVSARGRRKNGVRNSEIAFLNNYGTRHQKARPFWTDAEKASESTMSKISSEIYSDFLKSKNL